MQPQHLIALTGLIHCARAFLSASPITPGVIPLSFERRWPEVHRRDSTLDVPTGSRYFNYIVNITVGTPPQPITLSLDTGSSDLILLTETAPFCEVYGDLCPSVGYYNANKSSSYVYQSSEFHANFGWAEHGQGSGLSGDVVKDTITIGSSTIQSQQFAVAYSNVSIAFSILGLGYATAENQVYAQNPLPPYDNLPLSLAKQGSINLALFSLWKNEVHSHDGRILFGGIDTDKYIGDLKVLDIQRRSGFAEILTFDILLNGVKLSGDKSFSNGTTGFVPVLLDCGTSYTVLPDNFALPIFEQFDVQYFPANDTAMIDCSVGQQDYTIDFVFENLTISVPISAFVIQYSGNSFCSFGIVAAGKRHALLGDNFLSSTFTVFDLSNDQISLGARNFASKSDKVIAVPSGGVKALSATESETPRSTRAATSTTTTATTAPTKQSSAVFVIASSYYSIFLCLIGVHLVTALL